MAAKQQEHPVVAGLRWILAHRSHVEIDGEQVPISMRSLSRAAGLSDAHCEQVMHGRINPAHLRTGTLEGYARAGGVSLRWLLRGDGAPDGGTPEPARWPQRQAAIKIAREKGADPAAIEAVSAMSELHGNNVDPDDVRFWLSLIASYHKAAQEFGEEIGDEESGP